MEQSLELRRLLFYEARARLTLKFVRLKKEMNHEFTQNYANKEYAAL
jgi:hypothetical protein